jgi:hypothetical protein
MHPELTASGDTVVVAWEDDPHVDLDILVAMSTDGGRSYLTEQRPIWGQRGPQYGASLGLGGGGVYLLYEGDDPVRLTRDLNVQREVSLLMFNRLVPGDAPAGYHIISANQRNTCACNAEARAGNMQPMAPRVAADGEGAYIAWTQFVGRRRSLYVTRVVNGHAGIVQVFDGSEPTDVRMLVAPGRAAVVYRDQRDGAGEVVAAWLPSRTLVNLSATPGESSEAAAALSAERLCAAWTDTTPGNSEVFVRCVAAP